MNQYISKQDIASFSENFTDRKNRWDDSKDLIHFASFVKNSYKHPCEVIEKPFGECDVDIGIKVNGKMVYIVDVERSNVWDDDWPSSFRYVSFLHRRDKYLKRKENFFMAYFNTSFNKLLLVSKEDIVKYPYVKKVFYNHGRKVDIIKKIPFRCARLFGNNLTDREKQLFPNHSEKNYFVD